MTPDQVLVVTTQWRADAGVVPPLLCEASGLDALASVSTVFDQAVTPHPFGPFARAALLSGIPSPRNGIRDYYDALPPDSPTLARKLGPLGYRTAWFGKWHLSPRDPLAPLVGEAHARQPVPPEFRGGFSHWEGFESGFLLNQPWLQGDGMDEPTCFEGYQSDVLVERALRWWRAEKGRGPRFLVLSLEAPHPPYDAPAPSSGSKVSLPGRVPRGGAIEERAWRETSGYANHVASTADAIGRLWAGLGPERDQVHFIFTSVHGDMHGSHGLFRKGWPHEDSVRVPLLVHTPGQRKRSIRHEAVTLLDVHDALVCVGGGRSAWNTMPLEAGLSMPSVVRLPWQCPYPWVGLRSRTRKYVQTAEGAPLYFFDLEHDPEELENRLDHPECAVWRERCAHFAATLA